MGVENHFPINTVRSLNVFKVQGVLIHTPQRFNKVWLHAKKIIIDVLWRIPECNSFDSVKRQSNVVHVWSLVERQGMKLYNEWLWSRLRRAAESGCGILRRHHLSTGSVDEIVSRTGVLPPHEDVGIRSGPGCPGRVLATLVVMPASIMRSDPGVGAGTKRVQSRICQS